MNKNRRFFYGLGLLFFITVHATSFSDIEDHLYRGAIESILEQGIVKGYEDQTFRPDNSINRAEFLKILIESRFPVESQTRDSINPFCFEDLKESIEWYSGYVCLAKDKKIINGYPDQTFRPSEFINRAEAAKILYQVYFESVAEVSDPWYQIYLDLLEEKNLFLPPLQENLEMPLTRGEMAFLVDQLNQHLNNKSDQYLVPDSEEEISLDTGEEDAAAQTPAVSQGDQEGIQDQTSRISPFEIFSNPHPGQEVRGGYISNYSQWQKADYEASLSNHILSDEEERALQKKVIDSVNQARIEAGKTSLAENNLLNELSQQFAEHLVVNAVYSHSDMLGQDPFDRAKKMGYSGYVAEGMVWRKSSVESAIDWWKSSDLHWKNIVGDRFNHVGVGVAKEPNGGYMVILLTGE